MSNDTNPLQAPKFRALDALPIPLWADVAGDWELGDEYAAREFATVNQHFPVLNERGIRQGHVDVRASELRIFDYPTELNPEGVATIFSGVDLVAEEDTGNLTPKQAKQIGHALIQVAEEVDAADMANQILEHYAAVESGEEKMYAPSWATFDNKYWDDAATPGDVSVHSTMTSEHGMFSLTEGMTLTANDKLVRNFLIVDFLIDGLQGGDDTKSPADLIGSIGAAIEDLEQIRTVLRAMEQAEESGSSPVWDEAPTGGEVA